MLNQNNLLVNMQRFSEVACLDGRLFGVETSCDSCQLDLNACLRGQIFESLVAANQRAEADLGYNLTPRYHVGTVELRGDGDFSNFRLIADMPGVSAVNIKQEITPVLIDQAVSPYLASVPVSDDGNGHCIVTIPISVVANPSQILLRDDNHRLYASVEEDGYPRRSGTNWLIALGNQVLTPCETVATLNVQHCRYVYVDIPNTTDCLDCGDVVDPLAQVFPVYPGTEEFIPLAKPAEVVGSNLRYWFYVWTLVDPAFEEETVDLSHAQFYKLRQTIDFVCVREVAAGPDIISGDCEVIPDACSDPVIEATYGIKIVDPVTGILEFYSAAASCNSCESAGTVIVKYYYKTDPAVLGYDYDLPNIETAICYLAAATLPNGFCGCEIKVGFIFEAQKSQGDAKINPITGATTWVIKFGHTYGHYMYAERIAAAPKYTILRYF